MPNQPNYSSPFFDGPSNTAPKDLPAANSGDVSIRTMQDDLVSLQKGELPISSPAIETKPFSTASSRPIAEENVSPQEAPSSSSLANENPFLKNNVPVPNVSEALPETSDSVAGSSVLYKSILGAIIFFLIAIVGLGGYYFFIKRNSAIIQPPTETPEKQVTEVPAEIPLEAPEEIPAEPLVEKYSLEKPNYLVFDPATEILSDLNKKTASIASDLKEKPSAALYEFSVVDNNNNPVLFPIFAAAAKFNLSPALLEKLGENFSIFFYNDGGNIRLAISTTLKDKATVASEMLKQEATLVSDAGFLFLDTVPEKILVKFGEGSYNGSVVRYLNLAPEKSLSLDYIVGASNLVVGTSKNTARAIIDKLSEKNITPITNSQTPIPVNSTATTPVSPSE